VLTVPLHRNNRLYLFHYSAFRNPFTLSYLTETQNDVGYWVLAADTMKLAIFWGTMLPGALLLMLQAPANSQEPAAFEKSLPM
jgi:hypothetical protein